MLQIAKDFFREGITFSSSIRLLDIGGITEWKSVHDRCSELVVYSCGWLTLSNLNFTKQKLVAESILSYD